MFGRHSIPFAGKALWTRVVQCSFNFISNVVKWPNETWNKYKALLCCQDEDTKSVVQWVVWSTGSPSVPRIEPRDGTRRNFQIQSICFGKIIARAFEGWGNFRNESFFKKETHVILVPMFRTSDLCVGTRSPRQLIYRGSMLNSTLWKRFLFRYMSYYQSLMDLQPL